jgi:hypothetical protein
MIKITEQLIAKAGLSKEEARLMRVIHGLASAGQRTKRWVSALSMTKYEQLLKGAEEKIRKASGTGRAKGSGK